MTKNIFLLILVVFLLFIVHALSATAEDSKCAQLFENNCAECHEIERGCELLGQSQKEWAELFDYMEDMGADVDRELLLGCLEKPGEAIKALCTK